MLLHPVHHAAIALLLLCAGIEHAGAYSVSHTVSIPGTKTNWTQAVSIPLFPAGSRTLTHVGFSLASSINGTLKVESVDSAAATVQSTLSANIALLRPDGTVLHTHTPNDSHTNAFGAFDGTVDYTGPSGAQHAIGGASSGSLVLFPLSASDLQLFTGSGNVTLTLRALGASTFAGGGNLQSESSLFSSAFLTVTYTALSPDLTLSLTSNSSREIGQPATFLLSVANIGSGPTVADTTITSTLPAGLSFVSATGPNWSCTGAGQIVSCTRTSPIPANAAADSLVLTVLPHSAALPSVFLRASVSTHRDINEAGGVNADDVVISFPPSVSGGSNASTSPKNPLTASVLSSSLSSQAPIAIEKNPLETIDAQGCMLPEAYRTVIESNTAPACLEFIPDRPITFTDTSASPYRRFIETLKKTRIIADGDFIVSGRGNHSTGKQQKEYQEGSFPFEPEGTATRLEVAKIALIANCIPIEENPVFTKNYIFTDVPAVRSDDDLKDFITRVMQAGLTHNVVTGFADGSARPLEQATGAETLAILLRAAGVEPKGMLSRNNEPWYGTLLTFARVNHIVDSDFSPTGPIRRGALSAMLLRIMALSPRSEISGYAMQVNMDTEMFAPLDGWFRPLPQMTGMEPDASVSCENRSPIVNSCLEFDALRPVSFSDISGNGPVERAIRVLKNTRIVATGDYIVSGTGNHSTGKDAATGTTSWAFEPDRSSTRLEVVKTAMIANCIPIPDTLPADGPAFTDVPKILTGNADADFAARVFYGAGTHGIIRGFADGSVRPQEKATTAETLAILLRTAKAMPDATASGPDWAAPYLSFAKGYGLLRTEQDLLPDEPLPRGELVRLLLETMRMNGDAGIRSYRTAVGGLLR